MQTISQGFMRNIKKKEAVKFLPLNCFEFSEEYGMTHIAVGGESWEFNNSLFSQVLREISLYYRRTQKKPTLLCCVFIKNYRISCQHKSLGRKAFCKEPI